MCQKQSNLNVFIHCVNVHIGAFQNQVWFYCFITSLPFNT
jgi:hypothetical protein